MKLKLIILALAWLFMPDMLLAQIQKITFNGAADPVYNGSTLVLYNKITGDHDSVVVNNGKFVIEVTFKGPSRYMFYSKFEAGKNNGYYSLMESWSLTQGLSLFRQI